MKKKSALGWVLLSGASLAALGAPAYAQEAEEAVSDEIVVTATGRQAAIQDVPLAVTAIGGEAIANSGVEDIRDLEQLAPALRIGSGQSTTSGTIARIRGIGTSSDNPGFEGAVGIFIDGVYRARPGAALADLPEIERVEVLRGPQGTLFGRNTSAGAISIVTAGPDFSPGMYIEGEFGLDDLEETGAGAGVNIPFGDAFAVRVDGSIRARDGYITDLISGDDINTTDRWSARGQALWDISPDASLRVIVDAAETDEACCGTTVLAYGSTQGAIQAVVGPASTPAIDLEGRGMTVTPGRSYGEAVEEWGASAELNWALGNGMNFTSITAYRDWDAARDQDIDFNLIDIAYRDDLSINFKNLTQEFRLQGEAGPVDWLVGLFYGDEELEQTDTIRLGAHASFFTNAATIGGTAALPGGPYQLYNIVPGVPSIFALANPGLAGVYLTPTTSGQGQQADLWTVDTESLAVFTHNEIEFAENFVLTLGVRYNHETKDLSADLNAVNSSCASLQAVETLFPGAVSGLELAGLADVMNLACNPAVNTISNGLWSGDSEENEVSGTASLAYHLNDDWMIYGGYSRGYKAGGFNVDRSGFSVRPSTINPATLSTDQLAFDPEFTDAYELGFKSTLFNGTTNFNAALFYQLIHDYQSNNFNGFNFITQNIPEVVSRGVELDVLTRPTDSLTFQGGVIYNDAYYDSTVVFNPLNPGPNTINAGQQLTFAPEWSVTGAVTYEMPLGDDLRALFYLDARWNSEYPTQTLNKAPGGISDQDAYTVVNGRIGIGRQDGRWSFDIWGRNLTDEFVYVGSFFAPLQNTLHVFPSEPQTYGVTLRARY